MSQDLVPDGLPYGERQKRVEQMQSAGVPLESGQGVAPQVAPPGSPATGGVPSDLDALTAVQPSPPEMMAPPVTEVDRLAEVAATTPNSFLAAMIRRVLANG